MYYRYARMGIYSLCIMACLGLFLSLSCATSFAQKSSQPKFTLTKADSGKTITVHVGDKIAIKFTENPFMGHTWNVVQTAPNILKSLGSKRVQNPAHKPSAGVGGGTWTLLLQALNQGSAHLNVEQWRLQKSNKSITSRFNATINVVHAR